MRPSPWLGLFFGLVYTAFFSRAQAEVVYRIDPAHSELVVQVFKAGIGSAMAHDHVVRATAYTGQLQMNPTAPTTATIAVEVQTSSLQVDEPAVRQKYGLPTGLSEKDRQEIQATMESQDQLNVKQNPTMRFTSTRVEQRTEGEYSVTGDLTIRGITHSVTFPVRVEQRDAAVHAWGSFRFTQSSFGYKPYSALLGAVSNQDEVQLHFDIVAIP